jgi:UDP-perosamine 4-acetyltransferase
MNEAIVVIGAGGHAKVVIELLRAMGQEVAFCVGGTDSADSCVGVQVLKGDENLARLRSEGYGRVFVAIGANGLRRRLAQQALDLGYALVNAISSHAVISPSVRLGQGIAVMAGVVVNADAAIGDLAILNTGVTVDHDCRVGTAVHLAPQCALAGNVVVGDGVFMGTGCKLIPEVEIGANAILGAGAVVTGAIPAEVTAVGVPAKVIKKHSK